MKIPQPLFEGRLVRRYKRFITDVELEDGVVVSAHTPNTGSMTECAVPGFRVLVSRSHSPRRKLPYTLERIEVNGYWVDTHTHRANRVVEEALAQGRIEGLTGYRIKPEHAFGHSRFDFLLEKEREKVLLEVKNVTLTLGTDRARFPDAVTSRGRKHLRELMTGFSQGYRAAMLFLVQRGEARSFGPAESIDPEYAGLLREAAAGGVEVMAYKTRVTAGETVLSERIPVEL